MSNKQYTSWGNYIKVKLKDGTIFKDVLIYPNIKNNNEHILEYRNKNIVTIKTNDIKMLKDNIYKIETIL